MREIKVRYLTRICRTCRRRRKGIINVRGEFLCLACALTFLNLAHGRGPQPHVVDLKRLIESN